MNAVVLLYMLNRGLIIPQTNTYVGFKCLHGIAVGGNPRSEKWFSTGDILLVLAQNAEGAKTGGDGGTPSPTNGGECGGGTSVAEAWLAVVAAQEEHQRVLQHLADPQCNMLDKQVATQAQTSQQLQYQLMEALKMVPAGAVTGGGGL